MLSVRSNGGCSADARLGLTDSNGLLLAGSCREPARLILFCVLHASPLKRESAGCDSDGQAPGEASACRRPWMAHPTRSSCPSPWRRCVRTALAGRSCVPRPSCVAQGESAGTAMITAPGPREDMQMHSAKEGCASLADAQCTPMKGRLATRAAARSAVSRLWERRCKHASARSDRRHLKKAGILQRSAHKSLKQASFSGPEESTVYA